MKWFKRIVTGLMILAACSFLHYFLPSRDIVQVVGTSVKRMDINNRWFWDQADAGTETVSKRDVRFINATRPNGNPYVYRNEDTRWSFPPYFKFNSSNLDAQAQGLAKSNETVWVAVSNYGWRIEFVSMYPNAYRMKEVEGPDTLLIPWFNIVFLSLLGLLIFYLRHRFGVFKRKRIDPIAGKVSDAVEDVQIEATKRGNAVSRFFRKWFGTSKK